MGDDSLVSASFGVPSGNPNTIPNVGAMYDSAWDAEYNYGCKCDDGFRGPDCSLRECPSGTDALGGNDNRKGATAPGAGSVTTALVSASASTATLAPPAD